MSETSCCSDPPDPAEQHRVAALLIGAAASSAWRPAYRQHLVMVDALERVRARSGGAQVVDLGLVLDELRATEPDWPWSTHVRWILNEWDCLEDVVADRRAAKRDVIKVFGLILEAEEALDERVTDLLAAREAAEHALATLNRAYDMFESGARAIFTEAA